MVLWCNSLQCLNGMTGDPIFRITTKQTTDFASYPASEMTYIVSSGALNSTPTNQCQLSVAYKWHFTQHLTFFISKMTSKVTITSLS